MPYFLGVDIGGSKSHALIADQTGQAIGFGSAGTGSPEMIGYDGLAAVLEDITRQALGMAGISIDQLTGAGMGIAGYDWPSQLPDVQAAIRRLALACPVELVNDATIGILAGAEQGWGISVVAGTGTNCRGLSQDRKRQGRVVGGANYWSGEPGGAVGLVLDAMSAVVLEWSMRGPPTALSARFLQHFGLSNLDELIETAYLTNHYFEPKDVLMVFEVAAQGDQQTLNIIARHGRGLGDMVCGVIKQLGIQEQAFDIVLIGSLFDGHPLLAQSLGETVHQLAPQARLVRLTVPPVVGSVLLGMEAAGLDPLIARPKLIATVRGVIVEHGNAVRAQQPLDGESGHKEMP